MATESKHTIMTTKQTFPSVTIEALPNGLLRLEDPSYNDGAIIELHPAQVQIMGAMVGFTFPNKTGAALGRTTARLKALAAQVSLLEGKLRYAIEEQDIDVTPELMVTEFVGHSLGELVQDLEAIQAPDLEPVADVLANPGGQLTLPV